jgi:hypothetical protein
MKRERALANEAIATWKKTREERDEAREQRDRLADQIEANHKGTLMLERMVYQLREQNDRLAEACDQYSEDEILCKLHKVTEQRDRLVEALQKVVTAWDFAEWLDENDFEAFRAALESITPNDQSDAPT